MKTLRRWLLTIWLHIPFGNICTVTFGNERLILRKDGMVIITDGVSKDMLPIQLISEKAVLAFDKEMIRIGYGD